MEKVDKEHIEKMRILQIIRKNALNMNWKCMVDGCPEKTINSHLLQRHGVLDNIIEDGHMYELRVRDIFKWSKDVPPVVFKKVGLNDAISYPLFCNHHDTELFLDIEKMIQMSMIIVLSFSFPIVQFVRRCVRKK